MKNKVDIFEGKEGAQLFLCFYLFAQKPTFEKNSKKTKEKTNNCKLPMGFLNHGYPAVGQVRDKAVKLPHCIKRCKLTLRLIGAFFAAFFHKQNIRLKTGCTRKHDLGVGSHELRALLPCCFFSLVPIQGPASLYPFRTAVPFWGQTTQNLTGLSPTTGLRY